jgi:hypothetical protein
VNTQQSPLPLAAYLGTVDVSLSNSSSGSSGISFPGGRFNQTPLIFVTIAGAPGGSQKFIARVTSMSTSGCTVVVYTGDQTNQTATVTVNVFAVQMTSGSASG